MCAQVVLNRILCFFLAARKSPPYEQLACIVFSFHCLPCHACLHAKWRLVHVWCSVGMRLPASVLYQSICTVAKVCHSVQSAV